MTPKFTTVVAIDAEHLPEFELSWPTWAKHRPEIMANPLLIMVDGRESIYCWQRRIEPFVTHSHVQFVSIPVNDKVSQRHRMLNAFVDTVAREVSTEWYLKIDTDVASLTSCQWIFDEWFESGNNVLIAPRWGYTKPASMFEDLQKWADLQPQLNGRPRLVGRIENGRLYRSRIISYLMFGQTDFIKFVSLMCNGMIPIPSQDTLIWYIAERLGFQYKTSPFNSMGWKHSRRQLAALSQASLEGVEQ